MPGNSRGVFRKIFSCLPEPERRMEVISGKKKTRKE